MTTNGKTRPDELADPHNYHIPCDALETPPYYTGLQSANNVLEVAPRAGYRWQAVGWWSLVRYPHRVFVHPFRVSPCRSVSCQDSVRWRNSC